MGEYKNLDVKTIHHGLSYKAITKNTKSYNKESLITACYAGSLNVHKGVHVLLEAFKKTQCENIRLRLYGSGSDQKYTVMLKRMAENDKRIQFCGVFSEEEAAGVYANIDLVIVPSVCYETYSLVLHEALARNIPVVASNAGVMGEKVQHGQNGFLFELGNSNHLRETIEMIAANPAVLNDLKMNINRQYVPSVEQEAVSYEKVYRDVIRGIEG
jgi:glycosyltransferase involved in cell wall biosynthesis